MITKVGPSGNTLTSRGMDLWVLSQRPVYVQVLDTFITHFRKTLGLSRDGRGTYTVTDLLDFVGDLSVLGSLDRSKAEFLRKELPVRKISSFPDGLGKHRYIALGD